MAALKSVVDLIGHLKRMPGVGQKSAERMAMHLLSLPKADVEAFTEAVLRLKRSVSACRTCANLSEGDQCPVCSDSGRDASVLCVVEEPRDVLVLEKTGGFRGLYHVLQGALAPLDGVGPDQLTIPLLLERLQGGVVKEVILATDADTEGEATALYLAQRLKPSGVRISRIASGIPVGSDLEYTDQATLLKAMEGRREL
jgi:recombination protein RecR